MPLRRVERDARAVPDPRGNRLQTLEAAFQRAPCVEIAQLGQCLVERSGGVQQRQVGLASRRLQSACIFGIEFAADVFDLLGREREGLGGECVDKVGQREVEYEARQRLKTESYVSAAQLQEALALLESARAELTRARLDLDYMTVRAPFAGALQSRVVEIGDFVKRGDPIATYVDNRTIIVSANVSEFDAQSVDVGEPAEARLATGETVRGRIRYVAPVADEATRTFTVELEVDNKDGHLLAGGTAELRIPAEVVLAHRVAPSLLTLDDAGNVGVKIINDEGQVEFIVADIALSSHDGVWLAGLPETATIITVGQGYVSPGSVVAAIPESDVETAVAIKDAEDVD